MDDTARALVPILAALLLIIVWLRHTSTATVLPLICGNPMSQRSPDSHSCDWVYWLHISAIHFLFHARDVIQEGCEKYPNQVFRIPNLVRWEYFVNGAKLGTEVGIAPEDVLSFHRDALQTDCTIGPELSINPYYSDTVRTQFTRNLGRCFPEVHNEIVSAFEDVLALDREEWKELHVLPSLMQVVSWTSNRLFVGLPLYHNQEFLDLAINYTIAIFARDTIISLLPDILKPCALLLVIFRIFEAQTAQGSLVYCR
ncbi:hypothetical protein C8J57DRAFT_1630959 [Mycena rebaudengoi]|nr:hypothetical protein C8J57DRAFT_1630959 [Mycena rebaudengoi]